MNSAPRERALIPPWAVGLGIGLLFALMLFHDAIERWLQ